MVTINRFSINKCNFRLQKTKEQKIIDSVLKIWVDGCWFSELYKNGHWDGYNTFYDKKNNFGFGLLSELIEAFKKNKIQYTIIDNFKPIKLKNIVIDADTRSYQSEAVKAFFKVNSGIIVVPTRGGKTYIACECMRNLNLNFKDQNFLFIVDGVDLFNQTVSEFSKFLGIPMEKIGKINSNNLQFESVTVAMAQTLTSIFYGTKKDRLKIREVNKFLLKQNFLLVDEIQDNTSEKRLNVYKKCKNAEFIVGLSATPFKQMNIILSMKTKEFFGDICYTVEKTRLQKEGFLSLDKAVLISNTVELKNKAESYQDFLHGCIYDNEKRNQILLHIIDIAKRNKFKTLFIFNSKYHGNLISSLSGETFISGDDNLKVRDSERIKFLSEKGGILLASNIYKKGITLPEVELVVLGDGGLEGSNIIQKLGRILGVTETKKHSMIIDIIDIGNEYFSEHSLNRLDIYDSEIGEKRIEIYENYDMLEIEESIKNWLYVNK